MDSQLKKGVIELTILGMLYHKDNYGYPITKVMAGKLGVKESTVYLILQRLERNQIITSYKVSSDEGKLRKYYHLSEVGTRYYQQLFQEWQQINTSVAEILGGENE